MSEGEDRDTDPELFGAAREATTSRRCAHCGTEIPRDDGSFKAGGVAVLESLQAALVTVGVDAVTAAHVVQMVARESGITLV